MGKYIGVKILRSAVLMTKEEYCKVRGWEVPKGENPNEEVYMVEYEPTVDNTPNLEGYEGYVTMSPKLVFEEAYKPMDGMTFGLAVEALKKGAKVARTGWNGKEMFLYLVPGSTFSVNRPPLNEIYPEGTEITYRPHMDLKTADGSVATWSPSGSDALAEDWVILN